MSNLMDEFEKAINKELKPFSFGMDEHAIALWAARWMAERLAIKREEDAPHCCEDCPCSYWPEEIRQLAKELD